jgi:hypothetical protein
MSASARSRLIVGGLLAAGSGATMLVAVLDLIGVVDVELLDMTRGHGRSQAFCSPRSSSWCHSSLSPERVGRSPVRLIARPPRHSRSRYYVGPERLRKGGGGVHR